jgi:hypothetical protein
VVSSDERETLRWWVRRPTTTQALAQRARMMLACGAGRPNEHVARAERVTRQAVGRSRARVVTHRLDGLLDEARPGASRTISDDQVERVVRWTLESKPRDATTTLFAALNTKSGKVIEAFHRRQRAREFRKFLDTIHARVPPTLDVHLILDNSSTHKTARFIVVCSAVPATSRPRSASTSTSPTVTRNRSSGRRRPTTSSTASPVRSSNL